MHKRIVIIGSGENSVVVASILSKKFTIVGFLDDFKKDKRIIGTMDDYKKYMKTCSFFISIGTNVARRKIFLKMKKSGCQFVNAIHPSATIEQTVQLGTNVFIGAHCYINVNTRIGDNTFINNGCIIEHDNEISSHVHCAPGVITGGKVTIQSGTFIGLGTCINDHLMIGSDTTIGSGSVVIENISSGVLAVGIPTKIIKTH